MTLPYIARSYYWLPRVGGGLSGIYEGIDAGDWQTYITDPDDQLPPHYRPWPLPAWMPRKLFITGFMVAFGGGECIDHPGAPTDVEMWVDPGSKMFLSAQGAEQGADMTRMTSLLCEFPTMGWASFTRELITPVLCDRDHGDRLCILWGMSNRADWTAIGLKFLVQAPFQPAPMGPGY